MRAIHIVKCATCGSEVERCMPNRKAVCFDCRKKYNQNFARKYWKEIKRLVTT